MMRTAAGSVLGATATFPSVIGRITSNWSGFEDARVGLLGTCRRNYLAAVW